MKRFLSIPIAFLLFTAALQAANWSNSSGSGANTTLSNVTAVNNDLIPSATTKDLGSTISNWSKLYVNTSDFRSGGTQYLTIAAGGTSPSSVTLGAALQAKDTTLRDIGVFTTNNGTGNATATGHVYIESGNKTGGTGNSGNIVLQTGTSSGGSRGTITLNGLYTAASTGFVFASYADTSLPTGVTGMVVFNSSDALLCYYNGSAWKRVKDDTDCASGV